MKARDAYNQFCQLLANDYIKSGWKYSKSNHWLTKKDKQYKYIIRFYSSHYNRSGERVDFYGSFDIKDLKSKETIFTKSHTEEKIPEWGICWDVSNEIIWEFVVDEFNDWFKKYCNPVMEFFEQDIESIMEYVIDNNYFRKNGYWIGLDFIMNYGSKELIKKAILKKYEINSKEWREEFIKNYKRVMNSEDKYAELEKLYGKRRCILKYVLDYDIEMNIE